MHRYVQSGIFLDNSFGRKGRLALCDAEQVALEAGRRFGLDATTDLAAGNYLNKAVIVLRQGQDHLKRTIALD